MTETLTARRKRIAAEKEAIRLARLAPPPATSVLKKYEPQPPSGECSIRWNGDDIILSADNGWSVSIPLNERGVFLLRNVLRAHYDAARQSRAPMLGSDCYLTQSQIENFMRMKLEVDVSVSSSRLAAATAAAIRAIEEEGF